jgi:hypothetical protein
MSNDCDQFLFDPEKSALENFFALVYRRNKVRLTDKDVAVGVPVFINDDPDGDNTKVRLDGKPGGRFKNGGDWFYARADIETYYPVYDIDLAALEGITTKAQLIEYIDDQFDLVDGEFDLDLEDPIGSLMAYTSINLKAKPASLIYIGQKTINLFWSGGIRRVTEEGVMRVTDDGRVRVLD